MEDIFWEDNPIPTFQVIKLKTSNGENDYWIVKTDSQGNIQWQNTIGGSKWDETLFHYSNFRRGIYSGRI